MNKNPHPKSGPSGRAAASRTSRRGRGLTLESLVPEDGRGVVVNQVLWDRLMALVAAEHAVIAEFSWSTFHFWNRADLSRAFRVGRFLVVPLGAGPKHLMVLCTPGARLTTPVREKLGQLMREHELRYLPEVAALRLAPVVEDIGGALVSVRDDADYLYNVAELAELHGPGYGSRGKAVRRFDRDHGAEAATGRVVIREGLLSDRWAYDHLLEICERWMEKFDANPPAEVLQELAGIRTWPRAARGQRLPVIALSVDGRAAGVSVLEPTWGATWMGLVFKADPEIRGSAEFLRRHVAKRALLTLGTRGLLNVQQDAGEPGLRSMKTSYRPAFLREKYAVVLPGRTPSFDAEGNSLCSN